MAAKVYSDEEIERLSKNPCVLHVSRHQMSLTLEFRQEIYEEWEKNPKPSTVRKVLEANGFNTHELGVNFYKNIALVFKKSGMPKFSKSPQYDAECTAYGKVCDDSGVSGASSNGESDGHSQDEEKLIESGKFVRSESGIWFSPDFEKELHDAYPTKSIQQSLREKGFVLADIGYHRIYRLEKKFKKEEAASESREDVRSGCRRHMLSEESVEKLNSNPYVESAEPGKVILNDRFFTNASALSSLAIDEILSVFHIDASMLSYSEKADAMKKLNESASAQWEPVPGYEGSVFEADVLQKREAALKKIVMAGYGQMADIIKNTGPLGRKRICLLLEALPKDPAGEFTKRDILQRVAIPKTVYYRYIRDGTVGMSEIRRMETLKKDAEDVRHVFEYKGFHKGYRQVYMLFPRLLGRKIGLKRIRKIMKADGMDCGVRGPNPSRRIAAAREEATVKPNLLRRRFRLHRPNEVRVTDVTEMPHGHGLKAYGSALMDPVTGRLIAFVVSENNDYELAMETLKCSDSHPCEIGGIFHSDQGVLYKMDDFQKGVLSRGLNQSMSKKGNCWDNATQESFFGHFKDECDYKGCATLEELKKMVAEYSDYYNNERGMWEKGRMTPVEYEEYLTSMSDEEFSGYLKKEEERYRKMKERAAELAKKRYGTLGV